MPGEQGFISALDANIANLALAAVVVALLVVLMMALLYVQAQRQNSANLKLSLENANRLTENSNRLMDSLVVQGNQQGVITQSISRQGEQIESMVRVMEAGQRTAIDHLTETRAIKQAVDVHDGSNEARTQRIITHLNTVSGDITNLIEETGKQMREGTANVVSTLRTLLDSTATVKGGLDEVRFQGKAIWETQNKALDALEAKLGLVSENVLDVIQAIGENNREDTLEVSTTHPDDTGDHPGIISSGAARGGTGDGHGGGPAERLDVGRDAVSHADDSAVGGDHSVPTPGTGQGGQQTGGGSSEGL